MIREYELPNGLNALIDADVRFNDIPDFHLTNEQILDFVARSQAITDDKYALENLIELAPSLNAVTIRVFVDPPVTQDGGEDSVAVDDIPLAARAYVLGLVLAHNLGRT